MNEDLRDLIRDYVKLSDALLLEQVRMGWISTQAAKEEALRIQIWQARLERLEVMEDADG